MRTTNNDKGFFVCLFFNLIYYEKNRKPGEPLMKVYVQMLGKSSFVKNFVFLKRSP